jgi:MarR family transcriptional regulator, 2-MHQ and catechol-resistance regulon repressor
MTRQRTGALLIPEEHLEKHRSRFPRFKPLNAQVLFAVRALAQRINDDTTERLAELGLTARQYNYLSVIYVEGSVTPNEIGTLIHTANPTVTSMLNSLEREGLITRKPHPDDARSSVVRLTARGKALYEQAFQRHHDPMEETMSALSDDERRQLVKLLVRLGDAFDQSDAARPGPAK